MRCTMLIKDMYFLRSYNTKNPVLVRLWTMDYVNFRDKWDKDLFEGSIEVAKILFGNYTLVNLTYSQNHYIIEVTK